MSTPSDPGWQPPDEAGAGSATPPPASPPSPSDPPPPPHPQPAPDYPAPDYPATAYPAPDYPAPDYPAPDYPAPDYPATAPFPAAHPTDPYAAGYAADQFTTQPVSPGYPPQGYGYPASAGYPGYPSYSPPRPTNGMAVASLVLGIIWIYWIGSILALVFGYVARNQIRERGEGGDGMAVAGIVLGWVGIGVLVVILLIFGLGAAFSVR